MDRGLGNNSKTRVGSSVLYLFCSLLCLYSPTYFTSSQASSLAASSLILARATSVYVL